MNINATELNRRDIPRADFGRVTVFFGEKNGKYPDANQVIVRGSDCSDTQATFHAPGHTAGHCVLLVEPEGVALIGDIDLSSFGPYYGDASSNLSDFRRTFKRVADIPAKVWVTSHHRGVYTDREHFVRDLAAYTRTLDARDQRLLDLLRESPKTLAQLVECRRLYPPGHRDLWVIDAETRSISRHLDEMLTNGRVQVDERRLSAGLIPPIPPA